MSLTKLTAENVRCFERLELHPAARNLIIGKNASGKTSLLEAIFILGRGQSFRAAGRDSVIRDGAQELLVAGTLTTGQRQIRAGVTLNRERSRRIRIDGKEEASAAPLVRSLPVQIIDPDIHQLLEQGPGRRRRYLDWGLFHVEPAFLETWRRYHRGIRQRNALLKARRLRELDAWDNEIVTIGEVLSRHRRRYTEDLMADVAAFGQTLLDETAMVSYRPGWPEQKSLGAALLESRDRDVRFGVTHVGPHRADLAVEVATRKARGRVSRGQQKLLAATLVLAQLAQLRRTRDIRAILLLDDVAAELDQAHLGRLREILVPLGAQLFVTALQRRQLEDWEWDRVFHVEQGSLVSVV